MSRYPQAKFLTSANQPPQFVPDEGLEVAFAGRSNAGKSSAINAIVGRRQFARTSKTPGRTQLVNFFELAPGRRLVDLPGYGFARVSAATRQHWGRLMSWPLSPLADMYHHDSLMIWARAMSSSMPHLHAAHWRISSVVPTKSPSTRE